jgi:hypothetical protein
MPEASRALTFLYEMQVMRSYEQDVRSPIKSMLFGKCARGLIAQSHPYYIPRWTEVLTRIAKKYVAQMAATPSPFPFQVP